jgi:hypothetical protein
MGGDGVAGCRWRRWRGGGGVVVRSELRCDGGAADDQGSNEGGGRCGKENTSGGKGSQQGVLEPGAQWCIEKLVQASLSILVRCAVLLWRARLLVSSRRLLLFGLVAAVWPAAASANQLAESCNHHLTTPHCGGQLADDRPRGSVFMPIVRPLRRTLLRFRLPTHFSTFIPHTATLSCARTMTTKPSLAAAEDFLSFVNASPTRMLAW